MLDLFAEPDGLISEILFKPVQLVDLSEIEDSVLQQKLYYGIMVLVMKKVWRQRAPDLIRSLKKSISEIENNSPLLKVLFKYILSVAEANSPQETTEAIKEVLTDQTQEKVMGTMAQFWEQQGVLKGIRQGKAEGRTKEKRKGEWKPVSKL